MGLYGVTLQKRSIESAGAAKTADLRDVVNRELCVGQQLFGAQQTAGLHPLQRADPQFGRHDAAQMPLAHAQSSCYLSHMGFFAAERDVREQSHGLPGQYF